MRPVRSIVVAVLALALLPAAASALPAAIVGPLGGAGMRSRKRTGRLNSRTSQSRSRAMRNKSRSGFTTTGLPTSSNIGRSVIESEYA